jgi:hypothetical protein
MKFFLTCCSKAVLLTLNALGIGRLTAQTQQILRQELTLS